MRSFIFAVASLACAMTCHAGTYQSSCSGSLAVPSCAGSLAAPSCSGSLAAAPSCGGSMVLIARRAPLRNLVARSLQRLASRPRLAVARASCGGQAVALCGGRAVASCGGQVAAVDRVRVAQPVAVSPPPIDAAIPSVQDCPNGVCPVAGIRRRSAIEETWESTVPSGLISLDLVVRLHPPVVF